MAAAADRAPDVAVAIPPDASFMMGGDRGAVDDS
jgi:hypothetical protein